MPTGEQLDKSKGQQNASLDRVGYDSKELEYFHFLKRRLENARDMRDQVHVQFDGMSFLQYLDNNERLWNSTIEPKTDPRDWRSRARKRSVFHKGNPIIGKIQDENFMSEFSAYNEDNEIDAEVSTAMTHAVQYTKEIEHSEEIEFLALQEMLKHGFVAVQESFEVTEMVKKELQDTDWMTGDSIENRRWTEKKEVTRRQCVKRIVRADSLYFGNINLGPHELDKQPFIFVRSYRSFEEARSIFGNLRRFKFVKPGYGREANLPNVRYLDEWRLGSVKEHEVEIIEYQDKWNDEYQIIINGVMMLPVGYPMPWKSKEYNIAYRVLYPISHAFVYGHGLCHIMRSNSDVHDFIMRYMVDKAFQDLLPPVATKAARALSSSIFIPGRVTHGLDPAEIKAIFPTGMPSSATQMLEYFENSLDQDSIAPVVAGQDSPGSATAYEINTQMKQAMKALGPIVFAFTWLIRDLDMMRLQNILENLARPKSKDIDPNTKQLLNVYEKIMLEDANFSDGERATHMIEFVGQDSMPKTKEESRTASFAALKKEVQMKKNGQSVRYSYISGDSIRDVPFRFRNSVKSSPRKNSDVKKLMFGDFMQNATMYFAPALNYEYLQAEFARVWDKDPEKLFNKQSAQPAVDESGQPASPGAPAGGGGTSSLPQQMKNTVTGATASNMAQDTMIP